MNVRRAGDRLEYTVTEEDLPAAVGSLLKRRMHLTEHQIRRAKYNVDGICCDGVQVRVTHRPEAGSVLSVLVADSGSPVSAKPKCECSSLQEHHPASYPSFEENLKNEISMTVLQILYADEDLLAVNKPMGMAVHRGRGHYGDTLADLIQRYLSRGGQIPAVHLVGRLDRDTSGIVVAAKNAVAAQRLSGQSRKLHYKRYLALVEGVPGRTGEDWHEICFPMRKCAGELNKMEALISGMGAQESLPEKNGEGTGSLLSDGWMEAVTRYRVLGICLAAGEPVSLIEAVPVTGRTHQIRVHMAAVGHPLIGDPIYNAACNAVRTDKSPRTAEYMSCMYLHCAEAYLSHPFTGKPLVLRAPRPKVTVRSLPCPSSQEDRP